MTAIMSPAGHPSSADSQAPDPEPHSSGLVLPYGGHANALHDVSGYQPVTWETSQWVELQMLEASRSRSITLVTGFPGVGKSFMTARAAEACASDPAAPAAVVWVEFSHAARGRALLLDLYSQITGTDPPPGATLTTLRDDLRCALVSPHRLLVLDEAQHVGNEAMRVLRWLMDRPDTDAGLAIVGLPGITRSLAPEMLSRAISLYTIEPIADGEAAGLLSSYHPLFAGGDPSLLATYNKTWARGRFRWWANFLARAVRYADSMDKTCIDDELARAVTLHMPRAGETR